MNVTCRKTPVRPSRDGFWHDGILDTTNDAFSGKPPTRLAVFGQIGRCLGYCEWYHRTSKDRACRVIIETMIIGERVWRRKGFSCQISRVSWMTRMRLDLFFIDNHQSLEWHDLFETLAVRISSTCLCPWVSWRSITSERRWFRNDLSSKAWYSLWTQIVQSD